MARLIIAEKPSVAKNIADAVGASARRDGYYEGKDYYISWAFGHLLELYDAKDYDASRMGWKMDQFPFFPEQFKYKIKDDSGAEKQLLIIKALVEKADVDEVISACDYDREGQIIGDIILNYLNVKKRVSRILLNEWTPIEVLSGIDSRIDNTEMKPLSDAGISRQWSDWLIGINLTSVATLKYQRGKGKALNIGRVLMPTLKIIYDRDLEIENFIKEEFHKMVATFKPEHTESYEGMYVLEDVDRFSDKAPLELLKRQLLKRSGEIVERVSENKREYPPSLFNLTGLQGYITGKFKGWTSDKVLEVAQSLYEKKWITYPRTASLALEESLIEKTAKVLDVHKNGLPYASQIAFHASKRVFDNAKVESHSAIIPTYMVPKGMNNDEKVVFEAVRNRFIMQFMPVAEHVETLMKTVVKTEEGVEAYFVTKGRSQLVEGWRIVEGIQSKEKEIPLLEIGEIVCLEGLKIETKGTTPPKKHTEKSLLKVMETCGKKFRSDDKKGDTESTEDEDDVVELKGIDEDELEDTEKVSAILSGFSIGTPATRAETISKLKRIGYIDVKGKNLFCTEMGKKMVEHFPVRELFDLEYTGRLEKSLFDMGKNHVVRENFMSQMNQFVASAVQKIQKDAFYVIQDLGNTKPSEQEVLGKCPMCASDVVEGKLGYGCTNWKGGCKFVVWKDDKFLSALQVVPNKHTIQKLLDKGEVYSNRFVNKKGKMFSANLSYVYDEETGYFKWHMNF